MKSKIYSIDALEIAPSMVVTKEIKLYSLLYCKKSKNIIVVSIKFTLNKSEKL